MTVSPLQGITHACFGLSYLCAFLLELARLLWPGVGWRAAGLVFGVAGVLAHSAYLVVNQPSPAAPYGSLLWLAWVMALFYLNGTRTHAKQAWAVFVLPVVIGLVGLSLALVTAAPESADFTVPGWAVGDRFWGAVHGVLILLASIGVIVSFLASVMYLIQARRLRRKVAPGRGMPMLSLERLETMNRHALNRAFPLLTAGLLVGTILLPHGPSFSDNWLSLKVLSTAGLWLVFLVLLYLRYGAHVPARRLALFSIGAFALLIVALVASHPFAVGGCAVNLRAIGCNVSSAAVGLRERLAFDEAKTTRALGELNARFAAEAVILGTCNRVEIYLARPETVAPLHSNLMAEFLSEVHGVPEKDILPHLYEHADEAAARHLFRVAAGLDSVVVGEGQIAGQVKDAYEAAQKLTATGPLMHALFPAALRVSKRVRSETGIAHGHVSVSSAAVDFVRQVFDTLTDKTVLVIGAGKMGRLTLNHLAELKPAAVLVTNRSPEKAAASAKECGGRVVPWELLDDALVQADIVLSTTGAPQPIVSRRRFDDKVRRRRAGRPLLIFDMAVPRDFDPAIHDGDAVSVFNVDDLSRVADQRLAERRRHLPAAEGIIEGEVRKFISEWNKRANGPVIGQLTAEVDKVRDAVLGPLLDKLNGKLTDAERAYIEGAFRLFQNKLLHGPIAALHEASRDGHSGGLREALMKLFGLKG